MPQVAYQDVAMMNTIPAFSREFDFEARINCRWSLLRMQLLNQWRELTTAEVDQAGPNRYRLARLIHDKYGIAARLVENYLLNFERTLPVA